MSFAAADFYLLRVELPTANELAEQSMRLAQNIQDPEPLLGAHLRLGITHLWLGEFVSARAHLEHGIALYDPQKHLLYGAVVVNVGVACLSYEAWTLWCLGYPAQALKRSYEALTLAQDLSHPHSLAYALFFDARLHQLRRERQTTQERAEAVIALSADQGFAYWLALGTSWRGWALAAQGEVQEGIVQIRQGLAAVRAMGAELSGPTYLALLAEAYGKAGQVEGGLVVLAEALDAVAKTGERCYEAELYRLKGELTLAQSSVRSLVARAQKEAEKCFWKAIEIARRQQAKSLELRAVMSMSRLWQSQGKQPEAHHMLAEIYGWFTEGFDTKDLQEAKALLEALT